jgi:DNA-binding transcriptional LysR family regulator
MLAACAAGLGLAIRPWTAAALEPSLQRISPKTLGTTTLFIVCRKELLASQPVRAVVQFAFEVMREYLAASAT